MIAEQSEEAEDLPNSQTLEFIEELYQDYLRDPTALPPDWQRYFAAWPRNGASARLGPSFRAFSLFNPPGKAAPTPVAAEGDAAALQHKADKLIRVYRMRGHIMADLDPLARPKEQPPELDPAYYGFTEADMDREVPNVHLGGAKTLREIIEHLKTTYCRSIGVEFMHIDDLTVRQWLQSRMEQTQNRLELSHAEQARILTKLTDAVIFEDFVQKKYIGAKSFSLEGGESLIPLLDLAIEYAGEQGIHEIVLGMAHRGRLNVLANIMGKNPRQIFREFEDKDPQLHRGRDDVKYHLGYSSDWHSSQGKTVHLSLCFNPSHLEFVNPVALGRMRAKQDRVGDENRERGMVLLIHGDASFAGEGVVQESLNLSQLPGYRVGGALHVIINNQLGFTTPPEQGRSSTYASDVAKMLQSPIFHVNGEDPEAVAQVVRLAMDFRRAFQRDVVIDMYCYRRFGHNEGDEPSFTQPQLYDIIRKHRGVREAYLERLMTLGEITQQQADEIAETRRENLERELSVARSEGYTHHYQAFEGIWEGYQGGLERDVPEVATGVPQKRVAALLEAMAHFPEDFHVHPKIERGIKARLEMAQGKRPLDWAAAEALAFASLVSEGLRVRLSGQDSERGTFSHRHAVLHDVKDGHAYMPLAHVAGEAPVDIINSPLSETGVMGFEYGYSLDCPDGLVIWEAQYGDFNNAAQVIIDQFIASAEDKWRRLSGLTLLLPHGLEGSGPEHSSARLERFLMLAAEDNLQIAVPSTPAQYFHLLRRQVLRPWRKPLIVMTPKSLLRHPKVASPLAVFTEGSFESILRDDRVEARQVSRVLLCAGKVYYDLEKEREELGREDVAILRLEQLYPLREDELREVLEPYKDGTPVFWVQEEPENMGAWRFLYVLFGEKLFGRLPLKGISRPASASPATGSSSSHKLEQGQLLAEAFGGAEV